MQVKRVFLLPGLLGCIVIGMVAMSLLNFSALRSPGLPNLLDLMHVPHPSEQLHLFPSVTEGTISTEVDYRDVNRLTQPAIQQTAVNGGVTDIYLRPDHTRAVSLTWYVASPDHGRTLQYAISYSAGGKQPLQQLAFRTDGSRLSFANLLADGSYQTVSYYDDGVSRASAVIIGHGPGEWDDSTDLLRETKWRKDGSVAYSNVLNSDDSRTVQAFDERGAAFEISHLTAFVDGSTVVAYFPGTNQIRLQSKSTYFDTLASVYRMDGTLSLTLDINAAFIEAKYYDNAGQKQTLQQLWYFTKALDQNGVARATALKLYSVAEMDGSGKLSRQWTFNGSSIWSYEEFNTKKGVAGAPATCADLTSFFSATDASVQGAFCHSLANDPSAFPVSAEFLADRHAPEVPADDLVNPSIDQNLPIPYSDERRG